MLVRTKRRYYSLIGLLILVCFGCQEETKLEMGEGILGVNITSLPVIQFYSDTTDQNPQYTLSVLKDSIGEFVIEHNFEKDKGFEPESCWLDYYLFQFRVSQSNNVWYQVYTNHSTGKKYWIKKSPNLIFSSWKKFFENSVTNVSKLEFAEQEIKQMPSEFSETICSLDADHCFEVLEVRGPYLLVRSHSVIDCDRSRNKIKRGWIKWTDGKNIIVHYGQSC